MEAKAHIPHPDKWQFRFFTIWFGQAFSILGSHLVGFAFVWYLTEKTGSATVLAIGSLMSMLPSVIIAPIAGALVDRWNRKSVMIIFDSITALFTLLLAVLFALDSAKIGHIFLIMFIRSTCGQFQWAAMTASTTLMVPNKHLSRIEGANQALQGAMGIVGPALGAFLISVLDMENILLIDVSTAALAVIPMFFFTIPQPISESIKGAALKKTTSLLEDLIAGWKYVIAWPSLMAIIFLAMLVNFLINPAFSLLPLLVTDHFGLGAYEFGFINSALGVGIILGGLTLSVWGGLKNRILTSLIALTISGAAVLMVGLAPANGYVLAVIGMASFGFLNPMVNGPLFAVMQAKVEPEIQGRVFSLLTAGAALASPLGLAIAGPVADATNSQLWFILGGATTIIAGTASFFVPNILNFGRLDDSQENLEPAKTALPGENASGARLNS